MTPLYIEGLLAIDRRGCDLHPATSPDAIRASQRRAVLEALAAEPGATATRLSEVVVLPVEVVLRRLKEAYGFLPTRE